MYKEDRAVGKATLDWQVDRYNRLKIGGEYTQYDITSYSTQLTSQAFSDYYQGAADPVECASWRTGSTSATWSWWAACGTTGTRRASRPVYTDSLGTERFPRISTNPASIRRIRRC